MQLGRLLLRAIVGEVFIVHGSQKTLGAFGGHGPEGTGQFFESLGLRPGKRNALAAGVTETAGGAMLALGLATPVAAGSTIAIAAGRRHPQPPTSEATPAQAATAGAQQH